MPEGNGIDLARSSWDNPEGFTPRERDHGKVVVVKVCEAPGPGGWVCDLPPNHVPQDQHRADDGTQDGVRWTGPMADTRTLADREPVLIPAYADPTPARPDALAQITTVAAKALESSAPAAWAVALDKILGLAR
jgi:hypothetical protein